MSPKNPDWVLQNPFFNNIRPKKIHAYQTKLSKCANILLEWFGVVHSKNNVDDMIWAIDEKTDGWPIIKNVAFTLEISELSISLSDIREIFEAFITKNGDTGALYMGTTIPDKISTSQAHDLANQLSQLAQKPGACNMTENGDLILDTTHPLSKILDYS